MDGTVSLEEHIGVPRKTGVRACNHIFSYDSAVNILVNTLHVTLEEKAAEAHKRGACKAMLYMNMIFVHAFRGHTGVSRKRRAGLCTGWHVY